MDWRSSSARPVRWAQTDVERCAGNRNSLALGRESADQGRDCCNIRRIGVDHRSRRTTGTSQEAPTSGCGAIASANQKRLEGSEVIKHFLQRALCCPCGRQKVLALGLCLTCYTLRRQDKAHYAGNREKVLTRDGYRCRIPGCQIAGNQKRTLAFCHKVPGNSQPSYFVPRPQVLRKY